MQRRKSVCKRSCTVRGMRPPQGPACVRLRLGIFAKIIEKQQKHSHIRTKTFIGQTVCVLIEKESKRSDKYWSGRIPQNTVAVFPKKEFQIGDFVEVKITDCTSATLIGEALKLSKKV